jgi:hypothetical protein
MKKSAISFLFGRPNQGCCSNFLFQLNFIPVFIHIQFRRLLRFSRGNHGPATLRADFRIGNEQFRKWQWGQTKNSCNQVYTKHQKLPQIDINDPTKKRKIFDEQKRYRMLHHLPGNHFWDQSDPRFLVCEANNTSSENVGFT